MFPNFTKGYKALRTLLTVYIIQFGQAGLSAVSGNRGHSLRATLPPFIVHCSVFEVDQTQIRCGETL